MQLGRHRRLACVQFAVKVRQFAACAFQEAIPTPKITSTRRVWLRPRRRRTSVSPRQSQPTQAAGNRPSEGRLQRLHSLRPVRSRGLGKHFVGQHGESVYSCSEQVGETCFGRGIELPSRKERGRQVARPQCIQLSIFQESECRSPPVARTVYNSTLDFGANPIMSIWKPLLSCATVAAFARFCCVGRRKACRLILQWRTAQFRNISGLEPLHRLSLLSCHIRAKRGRACDRNDPPASYRS
jgi:hypothetical protein